MIIYRIPLELAFLFKDSEIYQVICELDASKSSYDNNAKASMEALGAVVRYGFNGLLSSYLKEIMYLAETKIPVLTSFYNRNANYNKEILDTRQESLEKIEGVKVHKFSQEEIFKMIRRYMEKNNRSIHSVAAVAGDKLYIGDGENQYFYIREDLKHFKELTKGACCVCGYKTYMALPQHRLPGRTLFVVTSKADKLQEEHSNDEVKFTTNPMDVVIYWLNHCKTQPILYNIGGESMYRFLDPITKYYHITHIRYKGEDVPWKEDDRKYPFDTMKKGHEGYTLIQTTEDPTWITINEYMKGIKLCKDPLDIQFITYNWLPISEISRMGINTCRSLPGTSL